MSFEELFMWGLVCIEAEFKLIQFPMQLGVFLFAQKGWKMRGGLEKEKCNFLPAGCDSKIVTNNINNENYMGCIRPPLH
jgi:hypothetical protein